MQESSNILKEALNLYWLRPENALAIASYITRGTSLAPESGHKAADFACGDGINTFFKCGGRFDPSFDLFQAGVLKESTSQIAKKSLDVFDCYDSSYQPLILESPSIKYAYGTDHKSALLQKANTLNFYDELFEADLRDDVPVKDLDLLYCNSLYWVKETDSVLNNVKKMMNSKSKVILDVFTTEKKNLDYAALFPEYPQIWHQMLNRGRQATNPGLRSEGEWEKLFDNCGYEIVSKNDIFPTGVAKFWNLGLRPIFPGLQKMVDYINPENRSEIKEEWVNTFYELLNPIFLNPEHFAPKEKSLRLQFVLEPK